MRNHRRRRRLFRRLALVLAVAAVAAPVAQARVDGSGGGTGHDQSDNGVPTIADYSPAIAAEAAKSYGVMAQSDVGLRNYDGRSVDTRPPDERAWPGVDPHAVPPQAFPSDAAPQGDVKSPIRVVNSPDGFDWGDAGIGAGIVFALLLFGAGAVIVGRQNRDQATA
jgi:hypothetical protein